MSRPSTRTLFIAAMIALAALILSVPDLLLHPDRLPSRPTAEPEETVGQDLLPPVEREEVVPLQRGDPAPGTWVTSVIGRVVDGLGHPVSGCDVILRQLLDRPAIEPETDTGVTVRTGADGRFRVDHPGGQSLVLMLHHEDFPTTISARGLVLVEGQPLDLGELVLRSRPGLVVRAVSASTGLPVPAASVELEPLLEDAFHPAAFRAMRRRAARSGRDGNAVIYGVGSGRYRVRVTAEGYAPAEFLHIQEEDGIRSPDQVVSLAPGFLLRGRVLDPDGSPVAGALVRAEPLPSGPIPEPGRTDSEGNFLILNLSRQPHRLTVESRIHGMLVLEPVAVDRSEAPLDVRMPGGLSIRGTVLSDGMPVQGARVEATPAGDWPLVVDGAVFRPSTVTDVEGRFTLRGLTEGRFRLRVQSKGFTPPEPLAVEAGGAPIALNLEAVRQVVGKVLDPGGRPLDGARIEVLRSDDDGTAFSTLLDRVVHGRATLPGAETSRGGRFVLEGLPAGEYRLRVRAEGYAPWVGEPIEVQPGRGPNLPSITLAQGAWVSGRVLGRDGSPVPGAVVVADPRPGNRPGTPGAEGSSDSAGSYSLGPLAAGSYELFYYFPEKQSAAESAESRRLTLTRVTVQPGTQLTRDLMLR